MKDGLKIMDSDMHVREPADLWEKYMEPEWRDRGPRILSTTTRSSAMVMVDGKILKGYPPSYRGGIFDATRIDAEIADARARGFDGVSQLNAMEKEGLDLAVMYPSIGLGVMMREDMDPKLGAAVARAYNNWLHDFCQTDPKRMKGAAMISLHDVTEAAKEARRAVEELGFVAVFARPEPLRSMPWHARYYDMLWSTLEELGIPMGFHSAASAGEVRQMGDVFGDDLLLRHICEHPMSNMMAMIDIIGGGVLERHPKLKVAFLECYCGWVSFMLHRMDVTVAKARNPNISELKPSEFFKRQCWISTEAEKELPMVAELIGDDNIVYHRLSPRGLGLPPRRGRVPGGRRRLQGNETEDPLGQLRAAV